MKMKRTCSWVALNSIDRIMTLIATDLPEPVVPATSRCGILARSTAHRLAGDVLAQADGQRRAGVAIAGGIQDFAQHHHLALLVGDLQTDHRLALDDLDHAHAGHRQRARKVAATGW